MTPNKIVTWGILLGAAWLVFHYVIGPRLDPAVHLASEAMGIAP